MDILGTGTFRVEERPSLYGFSVGYALVAHGYCYKCGKDYWNSWGTALVDNQRSRHAEMLAHLARKGRVFRFRADIEEHHFHEHTSWDDFIAVCLEGEHYPFLDQEGKTLFM